MSKNEAVPGAVWWTILSLLLGSCSLLWIGAIVANIKRLRKIAACFGAYVSIIVVLWRGEMNSKR